MRYGRRAGQRVGATLVCWGGLPVVLSDGRWGLFRRVHRKRGPRVGAAAAGAATGYYSCRAVGVAWVPRVTAEGGYPS